jgi:predicted permease
MPPLLRRLVHLLRRSTLDRDLADEIETHRLLTERRLRDSGLSADEAAAASRRVMGNITLAREDARTYWIAPWIESVWQDVRYALRTLRREPGFTAVAVVALASAIGLNTTLFTIFNALALRPWPVADPARVVTIHNTSSADVRARGGGAPGGFSLEEIAYFSAHARTVSGLVAMRSGGGDQTLGEDDTPASWVSATYFSVLGVQMAHGRGFAADEDVTAAPAAVAVLSYGYWNRAHGGDPAIVGRQIALEGVPFTVVGIAGPDFTGTSPNRVDVWLPLASAQILRPHDRWTENVLRKRACCVRLAGRLAPGVTPEQSLAELALLNRQFRGGTKADGGVRIAGTEFSADAKTDATTLFVPIFTAVILVLTLACANVGNLLVARAAARRREIAVRLSVGASRFRVIRQLLTESLVLAVVAGGCGLALAFWAPQRLVSFLFRSNGLAVRPDGSVLWFALVVSLLACVLFGLLPAFHGTRAGVAASLRSGRLSQFQGMSLRSILLSVQVAVAIVLVTSAGLLMRAVNDASTRDLGYTTKGVSVVSFEAPPQGFDAAHTRAVAVQLTDRLAPLAAAGQLVFTSTPPLASGNIKGGFRLPGRTEDEFNAVYDVSPGYFQFMGMQVTAGREFRPGDVDQPVVVINETMARRYWPSGNAVGERIISDPRTGGSNRPGELQIVGVVRDAAMFSLTSVDSTLYQPLSGRAIPSVLVRDSGAAVGVVKQAAADIDPSLRLRVQPLAGNLDPTVRPSRVAATVAALLGLFALLLACVGMAGVFAYFVQQRTQEIGIRMALGAPAGEVVRLVMRSGLWPMLGGGVMGFTGAISASRLLQSYLLGLSPLDPAAHAGVLLVLATAAVAASFVPARRATRVDPVVALRCE